MGMKQFLESLESRRLLHGLGGLGWGELNEDARLEAEGTDAATLAARERWLAQLCLELSLTLSKRLHIELYGDTRGT